MPFTRFCRKRYTNPPTPLLALTAGWEKDHHSHSIVAPLTACSYSFSFMNLDMVLCLEALLHSRGDSSEVAVNLGWRATQNERNNGSTSHVNVLEA